MRDILNMRAKDWHARLLRHVMFSFPRVDAESVVSDVFGWVMEPDVIAGVEGRWFECCKSKPCSKAGFLYGALRTQAQRYSINEVRSARFRKNVSLSGDGDEDDNGVYHAPRAVVRPEQEEVVYKKQLLEHCAALPPEQWEVMRLVFDRASMQDMVSELGLSHEVLIARRTAAMRRLSETARLKG